MMDWFTPFVGFLGLAIGLGYQEYRIRRERKDKYKDMIFEKRLDAHQEIYCRLKGLLEFMSPDKLMKEGGAKVLRKELLECAKCVDRNALYLARDCRREIIVFLDYARKKGNRYVDEEWVKSVDVKREMGELIHSMRAVLDSVERGVGVEYLPEAKTRLEDSFMQELHEELLDKAERLASKRKE
jgi:hypothetical protein